MKLPRTAAEVSRLRAVSLEEGWRGRDSKQPNCIVMFIILVSEEFTPTAAEYFEHGSLRSQKVEIFCQSIYFIFQ